MALTTRSSSSSYDVFLSFRGEDTRFGFTHNLYKTLIDKGVRTFIDHDDLKRGEEIKPAHVKAIQESRIAITVLSVNYASSTFCLDELATIIDCAESRELLVIPVFYKLDPSDIRYHRGSTGEALSKHEERFKHNMDKLQKWKRALHKVANFSGYHLPQGYGYEYKFIESIVESVYKTIIRNPLYVADYRPVGIDPLVSKIKTFLDFRPYGWDRKINTFTNMILDASLYCWDKEINTFMSFVHATEILAMGGLGKLTLARAVYNNLFHENVDPFYYLENVKEESNKQVLASHAIKRTYDEVRELYEDGPLELFCKTAFKIDTSYVDILNHLAIEILSSSLFERINRQRESAIIQCKRIPNNQILQMLDAIIKQYRRIPSNQILVETHDAFGEDKSDVGLESCSNAFSYDVFLSFRSSDTLHGFTGYLYKALHESGIHTFINDEELQRGEEITPAIVKAIEESRIAITVFSINYASSSFCLDELATIHDCFKRKRLLVLPVFYIMDPTHVRPQKGSYKEALAKHEKRFKYNMEKLKKWKMALHEVAKFSGFHVQHGARYEYEYIGEIVEWVSSKINPAHYPVGLGPQVLEVRKLLDVGCDDGVHMIGIHGTGGVGKSTLVREVYNNLIADHFDASCFIENVREKSRKHGLQHLQTILLSKVLGDKNINLTSWEQGASIIEDRLRQKKVLLILDDVDRHEQFQAVVGKSDWFGPGSKVIITTRDEQLLASHDIRRTYEVKKLNKNDALQLLKWKAFKTQYIDPRYEELLNCAVSYASGLPLALEIMSSNLFGKSVEEWKSVKRQLEKSPDNPIQVILKVSIDALDEKERSVFLDISCCLKGYELVEVQDILRAHYGHCMKYYIDVLVEKSLVKISHGTKPCYDTITLHDLIEDMGKEIDQQESLAEPGERKRLWLPENIRQVLTHNTGTSKIEIICLDFPIFEEEIIDWDGKAFQNMQNLKTIIIKNGNFSKSSEYLPNSLKVLEWWRYPSHCLPSDFYPKELAICKLPYSRISTNELTNFLKKFANPRLLNFEFSNGKCLTTLSTVPKLNKSRTMQKFPVTVE